ncbi:hypothetical protein OUZ56_010282 [Daphnia magna]|uniref:Uncharacterized protein n=1 Tax=Daphnia magna TaxID=35525 RepID=A0ABR0AI89_9CRUS|nr:hypothetical protein OUZ56_010282 [Daphnia magna]
MDGSNREFSAAVISLEDVTATEDERDELSVVEIPAIKESPEILNPSPNPETLTFVPSQQSNRERSHNSSEEQSQRDDDFVSLWVPAFLSCETLHDLDDVLERCIADWLPKAQILQEPCPEQPRGNPEKKKPKQADAEGTATYQAKGVRGEEDSAALQHLPKKSRSRGALRPFTLLRWNCTSCGGISQEDLQPIETISAAVPKCEGTLRHLRLVPTIIGLDELP